MSPHFSYSLALSFGGGNVEYGQSNLSVWPVDGPALFTTKVHPLRSRTFLANSAMIVMRGTLNRTILSASGYLPPSWGGVDAKPDEETRTMIRVNYGTRNCAFSLSLSLSLSVRAVALCIWHDGRMSACPISFEDSHTDVP